MQSIKSPEQWQISQFLNSIRSNSTPERFSHTVKTRSSHPLLNDDGIARLIMLGFGLKLKKSIFVEIPNFRLEIFGSKPSNFGTWVWLKRWKAPVDLQKKGSKILRVVGLVRIRGKKGWSQLRRSSNTDRDQRRIRISPPEPWRARRSPDYMTTTQFYIFLYFLFNFLI